MLPFHRIKLVSLLFTAVAVITWGRAIAAITGIWDLSDHVQSADLTAAGAASVIAAACWIARRRDVADQDKTILIRTLARTLPIPRVP